MFFKGNERNSFKQELSSQVIEFSRFQLIKLVPHKVLDTCGMEFVLSVPIKVNIIGYKKQSLKSGQTGF